MLDMWRIPQIGGVLLRGVLEHSGPTAFGIYIRAPDFWKLTCIQDACHVLRLFPRSQRENFKLVCLPHFIILEKCQLFIPWWFENIVFVRSSSRSSR